MSKLEMLVQTLINDAIKGDARARKLLLDLDATALSGMPASNEPKTYAVTFDFGNDLKIKTGPLEDQEDSPDPEVDPDPSPDAKRKAKD